LFRRLADEKHVSLEAFGQLALKDPAIDRQVDEETMKEAAAPNWSMTFLFEQVIPELRERGMTDEQLDQMMVENPKRWLA